VGLGCSCSDRACHPEPLIWVADSPREMTASIPACGCQEGPCKSASTSVRVADRQSGRAIRRKSRISGHVPSSSPCVKPAKETNSPCGLARSEQRRFNACQRPCGDSSAPHLFPILVWSNSYKPAGWFRWLLGNVIAEILTTGGVNCGPPQGMVNAGASFDDAITINKAPASGVHARLKHNGAIRPEPTNK
jgi:hypothetical protein